MRAGAVAAWSDDCRHVRSTKGFLIGTAGLRCVEFLDDATDIADVVGTSLVAAITIVARLKERSVIFRIRSSAILSSSTVARVVVAVATDVTAAHGAT